MPDFLDLAQKIVIWAPPILLAVTLHEVAHGLTARQLGDDTAEKAGRLSLNPFRHVDLLGTVVLPGLLLLMKLPPFGWAKPVPVNFGRLESPKRDMAIVAAAGPASNLLMAFAWVSLLWLNLNMGGGNQEVGPFTQMCVVGIQINLILMILNLLPIPPLDGGRILVGLLPMGPARMVAQLDRFTYPILFGLLVLGATGTLSKFLLWPLQASQALLLGLFGIR